ncbi:MAG: regulatory protein RecX [Ruminococcaceae bacterium]|nr:regulatory protein RecX [Oscillospiraceae bacterium]
MIITSLGGYKGDTWEIELDGKRKVYVNASIVEGSGLYKGQVISPETLSEIMGEDALRKAKKRALYLIGERDMCRGELLKKLAKTYGAEIAEQAAEHVVSLGYVNDGEYAPKLAEYLITRKKWGKRRVRYEMLSRGLDRELVENTLADIDEDELDEELITLIEKRYINKIADYDDRRRTIAALARRGYDFGSIKRCIQAVLEDVEDDFDDYSEDED